MKAIISGSTGLVGRAVTRYFSSNGIDVLCLGRQILDTNESNNLFGLGPKYLRISMAEIAQLPSKVIDASWDPGAECVFFNFAWEGLQNLTDGSFEEQLNNVNNSVEAIRAAKKLGCIKFVNAGTLDETFTERYLKGEYQIVNLYNSQSYALAKLAARDMCKMVAYLEKVDYVHTRMSVPLMPDLSDGNYIATTLRNIYEGCHFEMPSNNGLYDILLMDDVVRAFLLIGIYGVNKSDYYIGTSKSTTLEKYFISFQRILKGETVSDIDIYLKNPHDIFDTNQLFSETGFIASKNFLNIKDYLLIV